MITRINLIEKEAFRFTYGKLLLMFAMVILFCILTVGLQKGCIAFHNAHIKKIQAETTFLKQQHGGLLKETPQQWGQGGLIELKKTFVQTPQWSAMIRDLGLRLPGSVWLISLRGAVNPVQTTTEQPATAKNKAPTAKGLTINGIARNPSDLGVFMTQLKKSPYLSEVILKESKKGDDGFAFVIQCDIIAVNFNP